MRHTGKENDSGILVARLKQSVRHWWQRRTRGWDDSETWSLDETIAKFAVPRLKRFKELKKCYPGNLSGEQEWDAILDEIILALEACIDWEIDTSEQWNKVDDGLHLFGKHFRSLWW